MNFPIYNHIIEENRELRAEIEQLRTLVKDLADDLETELRGRYEIQGEIHPAQVRRYERDMANVYKARHASDAGKTNEQAMRLPTYNHIIEENRELRVQWTDMRLEIALCRTEIERLRGSLREITQEQGTDYAATAVQIAVHALEGK